MAAKEAKARIKINKLLEDAGWRFFDDVNGPANIQLEPNVKIKDDPRYQNEETQNKYLFDEGLRILWKPLAKSLNIYSSNIKTRQTRIILLF